MTDAYSAAELGEFEHQIDEALRSLADVYDHIIAVDRSNDGDVRWYVRMRGEDKDFTTVWLSLGQRTFRYETYVLAAPEENEAEFYAHLLRLNDQLIGAHYSVGLEQAVFLRGDMPSGQVTVDELDRVLGTLYAQVERSFQALLRIGFASRFKSLS